MYLSLVGKGLVIIMIISMILVRLKLMRHSPLYQKRVVYLKILKLGKMAIPGQTVWKKWMILRKGFLLDLQHVYMIKPIIIQILTMTIRSFGLIQHHLRFKM